MMESICTFLASAPHAEVCPARADEDATCVCGLWDARNELECLNTSYNAYYRDEDWRAGSPEVLAEILVSKRFRSRPKLDVTVTLDLSCEDLARFDAAFAKCLAVSERKAKLGDLHEALRRQQEDRSRLAAHALAEIDTNIAGIEAQIAALKSET